MINKLQKNASGSPLKTLLLGAGMGAGGGFLLDRLSDYRSGDSGSKRRLLQGLLLGTLPGLYQGASQYALTLGPYPDNYDKTKITPSDTGILKTILSSPKELLEASDNFKENVRRKTAAFNPVSTMPGMPGGPSVGQFVNKMVNTDQFGRVIWQDPNTRIGTAGTITNTLNQTAQRVGSPFVTPGQIATTLVNAGIGAATGWTVGKTLGAFAGVSPATQQTIQNIGMWGGVMNGIGNQLNR